MPLPSAGRWRGFWPRTTARAGTGPRLTRSQRRLRHGAGCSGSRRRRSTVLDPRPAPTAASERPPRSMAPCSWVTCSGSGSSCGSAGKGRAARCGCTVPPSWCSLSAASAGVCSRGSRSVRWPRRSPRPPSPSCSPRVGSRDGNASCPLRGPLSARCSSVRASCGLATLASPPSPTTASPRRGRAHSRPRAPPWRGHIWARGSSSSTGALRSPSGPSASSRTRWPSAASRS